MSQYKLALILQLFIWYCESSEITIYEGISHKGKNAVINVSTCSNIYQTAIRDVGYVNPNGNCARLYDQVNCFGNFTELYNGVPEIDMISNWIQKHLQGEVKSVGPCLNSCYQQIYNHNVTVKIFKAENYKGGSLEPKLDGCLKIPEDFIGKINSIKTKNTCIRLYNNNICRLMGPGTKTFELRPGTPFHNNINKYKFTDILSISECSFHCIKNDDPNVPEKGQAFIYSQINFEGTSKSVNLSNESCANSFYGENTVTKSIKIGKEQTCAILFSEENCTGMNYTVLVSVYDFNVDTKSIADCGYKTPEPTTISPVTITITEVQINNDTTTEKLNPNILRSSNGLPTSIIVIICTASLAGLLVLALVVMCFKNKLFIKVRERLAEKDVKEFFDGFDITLITEDTEQPSTELEAQSKPYNKEFEISRSRIDYDVNKPLRKSDLDVIYKGNFMENMGNKKTISISATIKRVPVTVKIANPSAGLNGLQSLLKEIKVMMHLGKHDNIAHMVGCCTENLRQGKLLVLMEFCQVGSLETYLRANRQLFSKASGKENAKKENLSTPTSKYRNSSNANISQPQFDASLLLQWCSDVSSGMEFLSNANIVHSDLAARNILLTGNLQAKISDFGLSRQMYCYSKNVHTQQEPLPWRWMAIESILCLEFTTKSDVWSYGVLCWEIFTLGEMPYEGIRSKDVYISHLEEGLRLDKPQHATETFFTLMLRCWDVDPKRRPTFMETTENIRKQHEHEHEC